MKLMIIGRRRGGLTLAQAHHYQLNQHGPLVLSLIRDHPDFGPSRYVENHVFDGTYRTTDDDSFALNRDYVTEVWFDNAEKAMAAQQSPFYRDVVTPDEARVVDLKTVSKFPVLERELRSGSGPRPSAKVFLMVGAAPEADHELFRSTWNGALAALDALPRASDVRRHVRNETLNWPGGQAAPIDCVDEFWLDDDQAATAFAADLLPLVDELLCKAPGKLAVPGSAFVLLAREIVMHEGH